MEKGLEYFSVIGELIKKVVVEEKDSINKAVVYIKKALLNDRMIHVFGTGHSQLVAEELFYRAGGLVAVNPILEPSLSIQTDAVKSTWFERLDGYAEVILERENVEVGDVLVIASHSGRNSVPVEMALEAGRRGLIVIALTALDFSRQTLSRHSSGKKLYEIADVVLNNHGVAGDGFLSVDGLSESFGPTSSIINFTIMQSIVAEVISQLVSEDYRPEIWTSANVDGGDKRNEAHIKKYSSRIRSL